MKNKYKLIAIDFLKSNLECFHNDIYSVISDGRMASVRSGQGGYSCSMGNLTTTTKDNPAKNIQVFKHGKKLAIFTIAEILKEIDPKKICVKCERILPKGKRKYCSSIRHSCLENYHSPHLKNVQINHAQRFTRFRKKYEGKRYSRTRRQLGPTESGPPSNDASLR